MAKKAANTTATDTIRKIMRKRRKKYSGEEKIRVILEGLRGEMTVAELCWREGISQSLFGEISQEEGAEVITQPHHRVPYATKSEPNQARKD